jgi:hypothetical protein
VCAGMSQIRDRTVHSNARCADALGRRDPNKTKR